MIPLMLLGITLGNGNAADRDLFRIEQVNQKTVPSIHGKVTDQAGEPLIGASIIIRDTKEGTMADMEGKYTLKASEGQVLEFSYLGYRTETVTVTNKTEINVILQETSASINEVVVVGYGVQKKINLTGAVSVVDTKTLQGRPVASAVEAIQGTTPGLIIQQSNSEPGNSPSVNIRGLNTMNNNDPLVIIDGIVGNLSNVAVEDIEQISVLKDAASTAIYGSRASNGIILVTTSKGAQGRSEISYSFNYGWQAPTSQANVVDSWIYADMYNEAMINSGNSPKYSAEDVARFRQNGPNYKWLDELYETSPMQQHSLSLTGGNDKTTYLVSGSFLNQASMFVGPDYGFKKYNGRVNLSHRMNDYFKFTTTISYTWKDLKDPSKSKDQIIRQAMRMPPFYPVKDENGNWTTPSGSNSNSFARLWDGGYISDNREDLNATIKGDLKLYEGLTLSGVWGGRKVNLHRHNQSLAIDYPTAGAGDAVNSMLERFEQTLNMTVNATLNYEKKIKRHTFNAMIGYSYEGEKYTWFSTSRTYDEMKYPVLGDAVSGENVTNSGSGNAWALYSLFGRLNYNFDERYLFEFNIRDDISSKFRKGNRSAVFPSSSIGWRISQETFFDSWREYIPNLKVRGSLGLVGNDRIDLYKYMANVSVGSDYILGGQLVNTSSFSTYNPDIKWETTRMLDAGVDVGLLNNSLNLSFDYFNNRTKDILVNLPVSATYGSGTLLQNAGKVKTWGWEVMVNYNLATGKVMHSISGNVSDSKNVVIDNKGIVDISSGDYTTIIQEGSPLWSYYGFKSNGFFQQEQEVQEGPHLDGVTPKPGDIRYVDKNGDGVIKTDDDRFVIGNRYPRYTFGFTYSLHWKGINFSMFWQGVGKRQVWLNGVATQAFANNFEGPVYDFHLDRWTPGNPDASYPRLTMGAESANNSANSDFWLENAAYLRLKNLQVGYTFPEQLIQKAGIRYARVYVSGQNLLTYSHMRGGWDPEVSQNNAAVYPVARVISLGLNVKF
ncbi:MAG: TonB-dependent receptor [Parabacteroides sp.]|nr:TonB-dependent receptor [Parabacteroides sp.]